MRGVYGDIHANRVLYNGKPKPGDRYRQIVAVEQQQFVVYVLEGEVVKPDPTFVANSEDAEAHFHPTLESALADVEKVFESSVSSGWAPYP